MGTLKDDLIAAKALIDTPEKWCQGLDGYTSNEAVPLCAHGACFRRAVLADNDAVEYALRSALRAALPLVSANVRATRTREDFGTVPEFNDHPATTHADVMALFDRAIASASPSQTQPE